MSKRKLANGAYHVLEIAMIFFITKFGYQFCMYYFSVAKYIFKIRFSNKSICQLLNNFSFYRGELLGIFKQQIFKAITRPWWSSICEIKNKAKKASLMVRRKKLSEMVPKIPRILKGYTGEPKLDAYCRLTAALIWTYPLWILLWLFKTLLAWLFWLIAVMQFWSASI